MRKSVFSGHLQCGLPSDFGPVSAVSAGNKYTCAMRADGQLVCFGANGGGQCDVPADLGPFFGSLSGPLPYRCSAVRWSARLLWTQY